jgi:hypothetical protein
VSGIAVAESEASGAAGEAVAAGCVGAGVVAGDEERVAERLGAGESP